MPNCYILIGPPCSGKSSYTNKLTEEVLSCDSLRGLYFTKPYKHTTLNEEFVWETFYNQIDVCVKLNSSFIVDNTNCRLKYINNIVNKLNVNYKVVYVWFDTPMWKLKLRNYKRWLFTGKWIPLKVLDSMQTNYKTLKQNYYNSVKDKSILIKN